MKGADGSTSGWGSTRLRTPRAARAGSARFRQLDVAMRDHRVAGDPLGGIEPFVGRFDQALAFVAQALVAKIRHHRGKADSDADLADRRVSVFDAPLRDCVPQALGDDASA